MMARLVRSTYLLAFRVGWPYVRICRIVLYLPRPIATKHSHVGHAQCVARAHFPASRMGHIRTQLNFKHNPARHGRGPLEQARAHRRRGRHRRAGSPATGKPAGRRPRGWTSPISS